MEDLNRLLAGRYRLTGLLGQGGMGIVWRAHDERLGREVAVKELRLPEHLDAAQRQIQIARLDREARAAARLKHPGIITVHDRITGEDGRPWIVMELVRGRSLADLLRAEGPLPPARVVHIGSQMVSALRAAHQAGITHRDIKPANVLLEGDRVVLTDFGIAVVDGEAALTRSGVLMGTPAFMAPEQVRGLAATAASDLWSLGATLYTAVEGRPPFGGASPGEVFVAIMTENPAPAVHAGPLESLLDSLLRKDPAERPTADQLHTLLARLAPEGQEPAFPVRAQPPIPGKGPAPRRRAALIAPTVAALSVLAVAALVIGYVTLGEADAIYEANVRAARDLGAPAGFIQISETDAGDGRVRKTFTACSTSCPVGPAAESARQWLRSKPSVRQVGTVGLDDCVDASGCVIPVLTYRRPELSDARMFFTADGRLLFEIKVG
ncbi:serine/threonine-protein kinase [Streptosporangium amethystogenes]|uniref:serine/threonine-protein kinase n=1 Tax=Streptosporangium amethystogenes TaxID=2002 RepID=UPI0006903052|nr:serine/threonine-protein kinase [Streptosporangium amethystogenes]